MRLYRPFVLWRIGSNRRIRMRGFQLDVPTGVFHPRLFFSTRFLADEIASLDLTNLRALELGCGAGLASLVMRSRGATVTAVDINLLAVETMRRNTARNTLTSAVLLSDLFCSVPNERFDVIAINPPCYPRDPASPAEYTWYCGHGFEYFHSFCGELSGHVHAASIVLLTLNEDCDLDEIRRIAAVKDLELRLRRARMPWLERNYLFQIVPATEG